MRDGPRGTATAPERAILVGVLLEPPVDPLHPLEELGGLAATAGATVMAELVQRRDHPDQTTYLGKGKVAELVALVEHHAADEIGRASCRERV